MVSLTWSFGYCWSARLELEAKDAVNDPPLTKTTPEPPVTNTEKAPVELKSPKKESKEDKSTSNLTKKKPNRNYLKR
ncbi:hypothetical protein PanWU01x14_266020 [Parasponia andersonii]|uniref:Uncharacterized protein n=1 Tax=Parasponia andersonii TaxID=3476 RepID=A0A2P5B6U1_PARAD|nr:hypothetical protein PanWU01x14_266020 [Parasponia andersonii]